MKYFALLLPLLLSTALAAQTDVTITVEAPACPSPPKVYVFNGAGFTEEQTFAAGERPGTYVSTFRTGEPVFRYVGTDAKNVLPLILGDSEAVTISGNCRAFRRATVSGSELQAAYTELKGRFAQYNQRQGVAARALMKASRTGDEAGVTEQRAALAQLDKDRLETLAGARAQAPILGRVAALNTFQSYQNYAGEESYVNEIAYFADRYFAHVDRADAGYQELPWTYEGHRQYASTLAQAVPGEDLSQLLMREYDRWPGGGRAQFLAMSGGFSALAQKKHPAAIPLAETIVERFEAIYRDQVAPIARQALALASYGPGAEAPLFAGNSPDGEEISLESLRGKVVLIDFWASWCGPCRKENPNVVRVYHEFKDQGFEILGVSLDKTRDRWVKAIADDKLTWLHVSDLRGWGSEFSRLYGVNSIPHTVLVGPDGKILARNLRGPALERKLREVFSTK